MKYEEYETALTEMLKTPDTAPVTVQSLLTSLKEDLTKIDSLSADIAARDKRITDLQHTNVQLLLSQTGKPETPPEEEKPEDLEDQITRLAKEIEDGNK